MKSRPIILPAESPQERAARLQRLGAFFARLPADKPWEVSVEPFKKKRSGRQNNAMWGPIYGPLSAFTGYSETELHDVMLKLHFGEVERRVLGVTQRVPRRTTTINERGEREELSRDEMARFIDFILRKAAELGCYIEDPNPQLRTRAA